MKTKIKAHVDDESLQCDLIAETDDKILIGIGYFYGKKLTTVWSDLFYDSMNAFHVNDTVEVEFKDFKSFEFSVSLVRKDEDDNHTVVELEQKSE